MKNNDNEIFSVEELNNLNEKLKENENLSLPQGLSVQEIESKLKNQTQFIPLRTDKKKINKKRLQRFVAMAASIVIVFTSLMVTKPWKEKSKPVAPTNNNTKAEDYSEIENMFATYSEKYKKAQIQNGIYTLYGSIADEESDDKFVSQESMNMGAALNDTATDASSSINHGKTNEQVQGVSESDIIKNDGKYIYYINNSYTTDEENHKINVASVSNKGKLKKVSEIDLSVPDTKDIIDFNISEIYVREDKIIAISNYYTYNKNYNSDQYTSAICYDISNIKKPIKLWQISQDGSYISSRLINDNLILLSRYNVNLSEPKNTVKEKCIPTYVVNNNAEQRISCDCLYVMEDVYDTCYLVASSLNINNVDSYESIAVLGGGDNVYCTTESLYVTSTEYPTYTAFKEIFDVSDVKTQIFKFEINNEKLKYVCNNSVKGNALNQFSIDEHNGYLRIATTSGTWGDTLKNHLFILDKNLNVVGSINNIAKGETIKSVRFTGDTGYVVTFEQTDPLFVIDLSDPTKPEIKGELKIPGFSSYLHPVGEGLLLGVGRDGNENGINGGIKVSLFDVSDPKNPIETDKITVNIPEEKRYSWLQSDAFYTHKAMCWDSEEKTMYIPYSTYSDYYTGDIERPYDTICKSNILAVKIDSSNRKLHPSNTYTSPESISGFQRVTYMNDIIIGFGYENGVLNSFDKTTDKPIDSLY